MLTKALFGLAVTFSLHALAMPIQTADSDQGEILTNEAGMSLYVFDKDEAGISNCNDKCADSWLPLTANKDDKTEGDYGIITRDDDSLQWSYKEQPLYLWKDDKAPGDTMGDGKFDVWYLAKP